jgi:two-component system, chemotaxis family, protein-glutamate methylesterase/glutaminase
MTSHDIIVIGASAGGVEALTKLVRTLPRNLPAALFVVLHIPADSPSLLPQILTHAGALPASHPTDGAAITPGQIYVAPADHHLVVERGHVRVVRGPKENRHRPAIDPLFRSAAKAYRQRVVGVILSGVLDDGTAGLLAIKRCGGVSVVQTPQEALYPQMPQSALENVQIDYCLPAEKMGPLLQVLAEEAEEQESSYQMPVDLEQEVRSVEMQGNTANSNELAGKASVYSCPECGGVLWEIQDGKLLRFRCRVGHAFSTESMMAEQSEALDKALWLALKIIEEKIELLRRLAEQARTKAREWLAQNFEDRAIEAEQQANLLQKLLTQAKAESSMSETTTQANSFFRDTTKDRESDNKQ